MLILLVFVRTDVDLLSFSLTCAVPPNVVDSGSDGEQQTRCFVVSRAGLLVLMNITNAQELFISGVGFEGQVVWSGRDSVTLVDSAFVNSPGGERALHLVSASPESLYVSILRCQFVNNTLSVSSSAMSASPNPSGAGLLLEVSYCAAVDVVVEDSLFAYNSVNGSWASGGAVAILLGSAPGRGVATRFVNCTFFENHVFGSGLEVGNSPRGFAGGGALFVLSESPEWFNMEISGSNFSSNAVVGISGSWVGGGGVAVAFEDGVDSFAGNVTVWNSTFHSNTVVGCGDGGPLLAAGGANIGGGGLFLRGISNLTVGDSQFVSNAVENSGNGVQCEYHPASYQCHLAGEALDAVGGTKVGGGAAFVVLSSAGYVEVSSVRSWITLSRLFDRACIVCLLMCGFTPATALERSGSWKRCLERVQRRIVCRWQRDVRVWVRRRRFLHPRSCKFDGLVFALSS